MNLSLKPRFAAAIVAGITGLSTVGHAAPSNDDLDLRSPRMVEHETKLCLNRNASAFNRMTWETQTEQVGKWGFDASGQDYRSGQFININANMQGPESARKATLAFIAACRNNPDMDLQSLGPLRHYITGYGNGAGRPEFYGADDSERVFPKPDDPQ